MLDINILGVRFLSKFSSKRQRVLQNKVFFFNGVSHSVRSLLFGIIMITSEIYFKTKHLIP